ncbi:homocysteine S-methyltransferase 3 [Hordeum vulgare]|nr:homocysteine S-methyltransferase 3 [Hordeum vulgare]
MVVKSAGGGGGGGGAEEGAAGAAVRRWVEAGGGRLVLDGGLATELEAHGADLNDPLWSAKCILSSPHLIRKASRAARNTTSSTLHAAAATLAFLFR